MTDKAPQLVREVSHEGQVWTLRLDGPPGNIVDLAMITALTEAFAAAREQADLKAIIIEGAGKHFSFGASVPEHLPEQVGDMLPRFHQLFLTMLDTPIASFACVRGQCLGGGMELAFFCDRVVAAPKSTFAQAEIRLGVFAPIATSFLAHRCGHGTAVDLCLSGRSVIGEEALQLGLADELDDDPKGAALRYIEEHLLAHSASSLRFVTKALRRSYEDVFKKTLASCESIYLDELMKTRDAVEGIKSFIEKRQPEWRNQ
jgi:cyclohexa-1,5-dienecarbonyl-CoA hydratase